MDTRLRVATLLERQDWPQEAAMEYRIILEQDPNNAAARTRLAAIE